MSPIAWDPPAWPTLLAGLAALVAWLALARPSTRSPLRSGLRLAAAALLALALLDVGCRGAAGSAADRLSVLLDTSLSMRVGDPAGSTRVERARAFLESDAFGSWTEGWEVVVDSFGGATTDPGGAVAAAAAELPGAILLLSDGRTTAGRVLEPPQVPLWAAVPGPIALADAAVLDVDVEPVRDAPDRAVVELGAVGGRAVETGLEVVVTVDGREAGREPIGPLGIGERRTVRIPLPEAEGEALVTARLVPGRDPVPDNDARSRIRDEDAGPRRALVVGLAPGWEMGTWRRAMADAHPGTLDALWTATPGTMRPVDGGPPRGWGTLDATRYRSVHLIGDPALLGEPGRVWVEAFAGRGGRGILWMPQGASGRLPGAGTTIAAGERVAAPVLTAAGRRWLDALGVRAAGPDGGPRWPALERLPPPGAAAPADAVVLVEAGGGPAAWIEERGGTRVAVLLGTGWYRWPIRTGGPDGPAAAFWEAWTDALARWLSAAPSAETPLVRLPAGSRVARGGTLEASVSRGVESAVSWRVESEAGDRLATGEVPAPAGGRAFHAGPFPPGSYRLLVETAEGRRGGGRFVVESWAPDLARTEADSASVALAARATGGGLLAGPPDGRLERPTAGASAARPAGSPRGLGTRPWGYLAAAVLLLLDWALASRGALARPERAG